MSFIKSFCDFCKSMYNKHYDAQKASVGAPRLVLVTAPYARLEVSGFSEFQKC